MSEQRAEEATERPEIENVTPEVARAVMEQAEREAMVRCQRKIEAALAEGGFRLQVVQVYVDGQPQPPQVRLVRAQPQ